MKKRKVAPPWSLPSEVFLMITQQDRVTRPKQQKQGVGFQTEDSPMPAPTALHCLTDNVAKCFKTKWTPLNAHRSWGIPIPKFNGKIGCAALRLIHLLCTFWRAMFGGWTKERVDSKQWPPHAQGGIPGRRRQSATIWTRIMIWRLNQLKIKFLGISYDLRNAFATPDQTWTRDFFANSIAGDIFSFSNKGFLEE